MLEFVLDLLYVNCSHGLSIKGGFAVRSNSKVFLLVWGAHYHIGVGFHLFNQLHLLDLIVHFLLSAVFWKVVLNYLFCGKE